MQTVTIIAGGIVLYCTVLYCIVLWPSPDLLLLTPSTALCKLPSSYTLTLVLWDITHQLLSLKSSPRLFYFPRYKVSGKRRIRVIQVKNKFSSREWRQTGGRGRGACNGEESEQLHQQGRW